MIRAAVVDIQVHPVKKLLFIKFSDQFVRDEVVGRLQAGLNWAAFDTIVTGWSMDKPIERIRLLGTSPETDEAEIRLILGQYGEIIDARKGLISSKKQPGCTNGVWVVKMFVGEGKSLPPFLIMKDDGEVWQLATGEASVCWKCGQSGHIGDKCRQAVNILAESLASPAIGAQPSWAHVVKGGVSVVVSPPHPPPPRPHARQQNLTFLKLSSVTLKAGKSSLKHVPEPQISLFDPVGKVVTDPKHAEQISDVQTDVPVEASSMEVQLSFAEQDNIFGGVLPPQKKVKLSSDMEVPRDPRLRAKTAPGSLSSSPVLHHKVSAGGGELRLGAISEGGQHGHGPLSEVEQQCVLTCQEQLRHGQLGGGEELGPGNQGHQQQHGAGG